MCKDKVPCPSRHELHWIVSVTDKQLIFLSQDEIHAPKSTLIEHVKDQMKSVFYQDEGGEVHV